MKKFLLIPALILALTIVHQRTVAQTPNWQWAKNPDGASNETALSASADAAGNVYITGYFESPSISFGTTTLINAGTQNIFIAKYDAAGNAVWAKSAGGTGYDLGQGISTDGSGNIYVTGYFDSPSITFGNITLTNAGGYDLFIVKYDATGNVIWAKNAGGTGNDQANSICSDGLGNVFITGRFESPSLTFGTSTLTNVGYTDIFIAKYDAAGNAVWAKKAGGTIDETAKSISADGSGNSYITGKFNSGSVSFGTITLTNVTGNDDIFIAKYDASGTALWAKDIGGTAGESGEGVKADGSGNVYATGSFNSPSVTFGTTTLTNSGSGNIFIVKYDGTGNVLWAKKAGSIYNDEGHGVSTDGGGNAYITGYFTSPNILFGTTTLTNTGTFSSDIYIAKYDPLGNVVWAISAGGTSDDGASSISVENSGNVNITGSFNSSTLSFGSSTLNNAGSADVFTAKLDYVTGITEENNSFALNIFPNPFSIHATLQSANILHNATLIVYNCFGQTVAQITNINGQTVTLSRDNLESGVYFVRLTEESKLLVEDKLVITDK